MTWDITSGSRNWADDFCSNHSRIRSSSHRTGSALQGRNQEHPYTSNTTSILSQNALTIARAALAIRTEKFLIARAETNAPLADFQCKSQSSSGYKKRKISYCQSRNRMMVMCMRDRLAMCLANICRHSDCFRYT